MKVCYQMRKFLAFGILLTYVTYVLFVEISTGSSDVPTSLTG